MLNFESDYTEGAHERILQRLIETNMEPLSGYGFDRYTEQAKEKILKACECPEGQVYLLTGGTQTNATVIDSMLRNYEGVLAAHSGHIANHESGAIEASGHKVLTIPGEEGKLPAAGLRNWLETFYGDETYPHMVQPGMVYISHPTEYGTLYTAQELRELKAICDQYGLPLFMDGARLGYGLMSRESELTLPMIAQLTDVFYIGGTKVGALCGEAVVFTHGNMPKCFMTTVKQHGALLAKGRLLGVQFDTLFTDNLYFEISKNAIDLAAMVEEGFKKRGYPFLNVSPTNQQFIILENSEMAALREHVLFSFWEKVDDSHTAVRFATSWATTRENVEALFAIIDQMKH